MRAHKVYYENANILGADGVLASLPSISHGGYVAIQCFIDDGAATPGNPSDTPAGVWELYASSDGSRFTLVSAAATELDKIKPNGNTKVEAFAILDGVPGTELKIRYKRTSGGGGNSRVRMLVTTEY